MTQATMLGLVCQCSTCITHTLCLGQVKSTIGHPENKNGCFSSLLAAANPPEQASVVCGCSCLPGMPPDPQPCSKVSRSSDSSIFPCQCCDETSGFWSRLEYLGDETTGLVMTKTKAQRGLLEPVTHIRKPHSIQEEMGEECGSRDWPRRRDSMARV